jgi:hypothetical protein
MEYVVFLDCPLAHEADVLRALISPLSQDMPFGALKPRRGIHALCMQRTRVKGREREKERERERERERKRNY